MTAAGDTPSLGTCCICGGAERVTTLIMLGVKGDVRGHGWGCAVCDLPNDGAYAVLCETCVPDYRSGQKRLLIACRGYPETDGRIPINELSRPHMHDTLVDHNG